MLALGIGSIALMYLCYVFSFAKTMGAIALNRELVADQNEGAVHSFSIGNLMAEKAKAHEGILKRYRVDSADREGRLWQSISSLAMANGVGVTFQPVKKEADTNLVASGIWRQEFMFNGSTAKALAFLDTLHKSDGIGRINHLKLKVNADRATEISLTLMLNGRGN